MAPSCRKNGDRHGCCDPLQQEPAQSPGGKKLVSHVADGLMSSETPPRLEIEACSMHPCIRPSLLPLCPCASQGCGCCCRFGEHGSQLERLARLSGQVTEAAGGRCCRHRAGELAAAVKSLALTSKCQAALLRSWPAPPTCHVSSFGSLCRPGRQRRACSS